jgi:hypothetical protein
MPSPKTSAKRALTRATPPKIPLPTFPASEDNVPKLTEAQSRKKDVRAEYHEALNRIKFMEAAEAKAARRLRASTRLAKAFEHNQKLQGDRQARKDTLQACLVDELNLKHQARAQEQQRKSNARAKMGQILSERKYEVDAFRNELLELKDWHRETQQEFLSWNQNQIHEQRDHKKKLLQKATEEEEKQLEARVEQRKQVKADRQAEVDAARERVLRRNQESAQEVKAKKCARPYTGQQQTAAVRASVQKDMANKLELEEAEIKYYLEALAHLRERQERTRTETESKKLRLRSLAEDISSTDIVNPTSKFSPLN